MAWFGPFEREEDMSEYSLRHEDEPHRKGGDRYAVYAVREGKRRRIAETNLSGIGCALDTLRAEGEFDERDRIGLFDRQTREWIVNPWA
jgi:hypothetical protein